MGSSCIFGWIPIYTWVRQNSPRLRNRTTARELLRWTISRTHSETRIKITRLLWNHTSQRQGNYNFKVLKNKNVNPEIHIICLSHSHSLTYKNFPEAKRSVISQQIIFSSGKVIFHKKVHVKKKMLSMLTCNWFIIL